MREKIENLKKKIKAKPKLYRFLNILRILCNVGAYLIALFTLLSLSISSCSNQSNKVLAYGDYNTHNIKQVAKRGEYYMLGMSEIASYNGLQSVLTWATSVNTNYIGWAQCDGNVRYYNLVQDSPITEENTDNLFKIEQMGTTIPTQSDFFSARKIRFFSQVNYYENFHRKYYFIGFGADGTNYEYGIEWRVYSSISNTSDLDFGDGSESSYLFGSRSFITDENGVRTYLTDEWHDACYFFYGSTSYLMFRGLIEDSITGYSTGYADGLANGYNVGYNDGYTTGSTGLSTNPFNLVSNAFDSIASLLNIEILPFLTLGTLIFVPLIVLILIVLFKMFKG